MKTLLCTLLLFPLFLSAQGARQFQQLDAAFEKHFAERKYPGLVYGVVAGGKLVHFRALGVGDTESKWKVDTKSVFRIASMTKSFTALAVLKLRDEGKLSLDDPLTKFVPQAKRWQAPTGDAPPITVRQLLTHSAGFAEDNPWGDRQLDISEAKFNQWLAEGFPFSTTPGTEYEYSNYGFALLGRIVSVASGQGYAVYLRDQILRPLGMNSSFVEARDVPADQRVKGYGLREGNYFEIPSLGHGAFGAMGGLHTSAEDLAKYVAYHLSAFPARDGEDRGPVKRSSVREMQQMHRLGAMRTVGQNKAPLTSGYGFGLGISQDCELAHVVGHGGGLPGYGSYMMWLPEYGVGMFAMANLTYASTASVLREVLQTWAREGAIAPRKPPVTPLLRSVAEELTKLFNEPGAANFDKLAADNLYLDLPRELRLAAIEKLRAARGSCRIGDFAAENLLRGVFRLECERGTPVDVSFTLAPTKPPLVQHLEYFEAKAAQPVGYGPRCQP